jgi:hypothetical protein
MTAEPATPNASAIIASLSTDEIRRRLDELAAERDALLVLLRAALSRDRQKKGTEPSIGRGGR